MRLATGPAAAAGDPPMLARFRSGLVAQYPPPGPIFA